MIDFTQLWHVAGWTMIHFLWTGALVALAIGVVRLALRWAPPATRYAATLGGFLVLAALPVAIGVYVARTSPTVAERTLAMNDMRVTGEFSPQRQAGYEFVTLDRQPTGRIQPAAEPPELPRQATDQLRWLAIAGDALDTAVPLLPWVWLVGTPLTFALLATGLVGVARMRRSGQKISEGPIVECLATVRRSLRIGQRVAVAVSDQIVSPVLVGIVRPLVLLPPAALTGWTPDQIEMVLLHELAHVRRWDNLVNLLQRVVEALLFFHPAVWIASNWVRRDREACCDAIVVAKSAKPQAYAELLVALASPVHGTTPALASALGRHPLARRIRQILKLEDEAMLVTSKSLTLAALLVVAFGLFAAANLTVYGQADEPPQEDQPATAKSSQATTDEEPFVGEPGSNFFAGQTEAEAEAKSDDKHPLFPTLEEQKMADLAFKLLNLELENIDEEARAEVEKLGYGGGVRVARAHGSAGQFGGGRVSSDINAGDILVGLHVWPTENMEDVADVLLRDDIDQLNPLKYYVAKKGFVTVESEEQPGQHEEQEFYGVSTGRITVDLNHWSAARRRAAVAKAQEARKARGGMMGGYGGYGGEMGGYGEGEMGGAMFGYGGEMGSRARRGNFGRELQPAENGQPPRPARPTPPDQPPEPTRPPEAPPNDPPAPAQDAATELRYDGKSFDEWAHQWRTELKTEARTEAVRALAAFARADEEYAKRATEEILDMASQYNFDSMDQQPHWPIVGAFTSDQGSIQPETWLPLLKQRLDKDLSQYESLAFWLLAFAGPMPPDLMPLVIELSESESTKVQRSAVEQICSADPGLEKEITRQVLRRALGSDDVSVRILAASQLFHSDASGEVSSRDVRPSALDPFVPDLMRLLFDPDPTVRRYVHDRIDKVSAEQGRAIAEHLVAKLEEPNISKEERAAAIRGLKALKGKVQLAQKKLDELSSKTESED